MGALQRFGGRLIEAVEDRTGRELVAQPRMQLLESAEGEARVLRRTLEWIGWNLFNYLGQQPTPYQMPKDMLPMARVFAASQALRAWVEDPMAGQQVDLYVSFVFGRGVPKPQAHDDEVQDVLDRCWKDKSNQRVLTDFDRLTEKGVDLALQSSVFFRYFDDGEDGMARASLLTFEDMHDVVRHPVDRFRILYWKGVERRIEYDYSIDNYRQVGVTNGQPAQLVYYEDIDAYDDDDPVMAAQDAAAGGKAALAPPANRLRPGKVVALTVNKTSEMAFGVPRFRRLQRWFTAYNEVLESHVNRMKAMASIYMKATVRGPQTEIDRLAHAAMGRRGAFGDAAEAQPGGPRTLPDPHSRGPAGPGVLWENESLQHTPFKIDSGAADMAATMPGLAAQASGIWPPTYFGQDPGALAGAQAVELPVLKFIEREQEAWLKPFRKLGDLAIEAALRVGDLTEWRDPTQLELERIQAAAAQGDPLDGLEVDPDTGKVKRDLSFDISLPSPLKRAMGDLVTAAVATATAIDPMGTNPELSRWLFGFLLAEAFDVDDPMRIVDTVLPRHVAAAMAAGGEIDPATGQPRPPAAPADATSTGPDGQQHPPANPYGAKVASPQPEDRKVQEAAVDRVRAAAEAAAPTVAKTGDAFDELERLAEQVSSALAPVQGD